jgi:DNA-binding transcriptional ArsR family regulator
VHKPRVSRPRRKLRQLRAARKTCGEGPTPTATALAEPNRLRIVELLRDGACPVGEIGQRLRLNQPQVSKHLRVLRDAGLVDVEVRAQQRLYELRAEPLRELSDWVERFRRLWDERFDRLEEYLEQMSKAKKKKTLKGEP